MPMPPKPPRPPVVDLSCYHLPEVKGLLTCYYVLLLADSSQCNSALFDFCFPLLWIRTEEYDRTLN